MMKPDDLLPGEHRLIVRVQSEHFTDVFSTIATDRQDVARWLRRLADHFRDIPDGEALYLPRPKP